MMQMQPIQTQILLQTKQPLIVQTNAAMTGLIGIA